MADAVADKLNFALRRAQETVGTPQEICAVHSHLEELTRRHARTGFFKYKIMDIDSVL